MNYFFLLKIISLSLKLVILKEVMLTLENNIKMIVSSE